MGLTVLDAGILIGLLESTDAHHIAASAALETEMEERSELVMPATGYSEVLVRPWQLGRDRVEVVERLISQIDLEVVAIDEVIAGWAARIRASPTRTLKLPDALVLAVAIEVGADRVLTTGTRWPGAAQLGFDGEVRVV